MSAFQLLDDPGALSTRCAALVDSHWLSLDTEFERINTYYPRLCLVQIATATDSFIIDPLKLDYIQPLLDLIYRPSITKVLHSAHQDLEILFNLTGKIPTPLFDTQLAAPLYGFNKGIGYGNLVKEALQVELDKGHARTDWTRRPLTSAQLRYAADDVIYLAQIYQLFLQRMGEIDKAKLEDLFAVLYQTDTYVPDPARMWKKIFALRRLKGKPLQVAKKLAAWRELTARKENRPRKWVLADQSLVDIAKRLPMDASEFSDIDRISDSMAERYGKEWLQILAEYR